VVNIYIYSNLISNEDIINDILKQFDNNVSLEHDKNGKPYLLNSNMFISFSDSDDYKVVGISDIDIGIDIEHIKEHNYQRVVNKMFSKEKTLINNLDDFINYWTKKEAISKLEGLGLKLNFNKIDLSKYQIITNKINDYYLSIASNTKTTYQIIYK